MNESSSSMNLNSRRPEDELLRKPGEVHHHGGERRAEFDAEVTVGDGINAVHRDAVEAQRSRRHTAVGVIRRTRERARAERETFMCRPAS